MKVILVYDIALEEPQDQNRLNKVRKIARKYMHHLQKSVFEGELTESKLENLKHEIRQAIDKDRDSVIIYVIKNTCKIDRVFITNNPDTMDNII